MWRQIFLYVNNNEEEKWISPSIIKPQRNRGQILKLQDSTCPISEEKSKRKKIFCRYFKRWQNRESNQSHHKRLPVWTQPSAYSSQNSSVYLWVVECVKPTSSCKRTYSCSHIISLAIFFSCKIKSSLFHMQGNTAMHKDSVLGNSNSFAKAFKMTTKKYTENIRA